MNPTPEVRALNEGDLPGWHAARQLAFMDRSDLNDPAVRARYLERLPYARGHFAGETLTAAALMYPFEMYLAGVRVSMGGLAGVLSAPEYRRRGSVKALLFEMLKTLHEERVGWCLEYPFDPRFYARYGFASVPTGAEVSVPAERLYRGRAPDGVKRVGETSALKPLLNPLYEQWASGYSFTLVRNAQARPDWERVSNSAGTDEARFCYLLGDAYCVLELSSGERGQALEVCDYAYTSPSGYDALWTFVGSFHGQVEYISAHLSADDPLLFDVQRYKTRTLPTLQARVIDVESALAPLASPQASTFALRVEDSFCSWNGRTFGLELSVSGTRVAPTTAAPDLTLDIGTLARLLSGALSAHAAARVGLLSGSPKTARALGALAGERLPFMPSSDFF